MKPCSKFKRHLAWLAVDALDASKARDLRAHVETCEGCGRYLAEISTVTQNLAAMEPEASVHPSGSFHQRVVRKLRAKRSRSIWELGLARFNRGLSNWRIALPATAAAVCLGLLVLVWPRPSASKKQVTVLQSFSAPVSKPDLSPTFANYQMVANQSLEKFDELLSKQGHGNPFPSRTYAASTVEE